MLIKHMDPMIKHVVLYISSNLVIPKENIFKLGNWPGNYKIKGELII